MFVSTELIIKINKKIEIKTHMKLSE